MADTPKSIKVVDRRMFTADGEIREEIRAELEAQASTPEPVEAPAPAPPEPAVATSPAFLRLLDMLAQTASIYLQGLPDPATGRRAVDLNAIRDIVEALMALRDKTRGRLSFEETDNIEGILGELQMAYSRLASPGKGPAVPAPPGSKKRG
jgi:hypothetical protein